MIDLETGEVILYKCMLCEKKGKTLFEEQLFYHTLPRAFKHLINVHGLKKPEIKVGTPKLWTHYLKYIQYILTDDNLEQLRKYKKTREKKRQILKIIENDRKGLEKLIAKTEETGHPPSLRFSHNRTSNSNG